MVRVLTPSFSGSKDVSGILPALLRRRKADLTGWVALGRDLYQGKHSALRPKAYAELALDTGRA